MKLVTWYIRGLNKIPIQKEVKRFIRSNKISMIALLEHKINKKKAIQIIRKITTGWDWLANYEHSSKRRIWLLWDANEIECLELGKSSQFTHTAVHIKSMNMRFDFTAVYGLHTLEDRRYLWRDLADINIRQQGPWLIMGDYNAIRSGEDRPIENPVQELEVRDFNSFIDDNALVEMRTNGRNFTWTNGHTYNKIDRALANAEWMLKMLYLEVWVMDPGCSDHSPLNVSFEDNEEKVPKPFKFLNHLAEHKDFLALVSGAWQGSNEDNTMKDVWKRLKRVKQAMKELNNTEYNAVGDKIK
ncbi:uncharacterized protein LOC107831867 [Nicotiana tabacum]|uniref:Uncharacterized protein LOC107831867 n=1 Tax=Nicotiana tabacum TaxID=4097 RepID=A0A1S4DNZ5_TOBAC